MALAPASIRPVARAIAGSLLALALVSPTLAPAQPPPSAPSLAPSLPTSAATSAPAISVGGFSSYDPAPSPAVFALWTPSLVGSPASMARQNRQAELHAYTYLRTPEDLGVFLRHGLFVPVSASESLGIEGASFPYARPETARFLEVLSARYLAACGEKLVVTSLTRPKSHQPPNASLHSVHPTGMAIDLRRSRSRACRTALENDLLDLEGRGILEATRESWPAHYHVALFPEPFMAYLATWPATELPPTTVASYDPAKFEAAAQAAVAAQRSTRSTLTRSTPTRYRVARGDTLFGIARRFGTTVATLKRLNRLRGSVVARGAVLKIPAAAAPAASIEITRHESESAAETPRTEAVAALATSEVSETPSPPRAKTQTVRVERGDTLFKIAQRHGLTVDALRRANSLRGSTVYVGQKLRLPSSTQTAQAEKASSKPRPRYHRVGRGETLWEIARRHGVSVASLERENGIAARGLRAGQVLEIPAR